MRDAFKAVAQLVVGLAAHKLGMCSCGDRPGWVEYVGDRGSELLPLDDAVAHERGDGCACLPHVQYHDTADGDEWTVLHHAWDGRT